MAGYIGSKASVVSSGVERKKTYSITGSTTSLTGLNYTVGKVHVYQNGVRLLDGTDYTATNGTSITLTVAAQSGDNVVVVSQASFQLSESYTSTEADARYVQPTHTGNLDITGTVTSDGLTVSTSNPEIEITNAGQRAYSFNVTGTSFYLKDKSDAQNIIKVDEGGDISFYEDTGATAKFFWDASAESLGIGTSSPSKKAHLYASNDAASLRLENTANSKVWDITPARPNVANTGLSIYNVTDDRTDLHVDNSGNVGIGTSSPTRQLDVSKAGTAYIRASDTANSVNMEMLAASSGGWLGTQTNHSLNFQTNNTERMRITSSGAVTMPYQPNFLARLPNTTTSLTAGAWTIFSFNTTEWDRGTNFTNSTHRFTAPVAGIYFFHWLIQIEAITTAPTWYYAYPLVNGSQTIGGTKGTTAADQVEPTGYYHGIKGTQSLQLAANDYVELKYYWSGGNGVVKGGSESMFAGHLIG
jgi:hypothetical protein